MKAITLVSDSLRWAFHQFADNLSLFIKLVLTFGLVTLVTCLLSFGLAMLIVPFYFTLCFIKVALMLYDGQKVHTIEECLVGWKPFAKGFVALCIYSFVVCAGLILFIVPGIYIASRYYYIIYCIMGDDAGIIESFQSSSKLTEQLPWHGFLLLCCATILGSIWFLLPVAALMNVYAYTYCKQHMITKAQE